MSRGVPFFLVGSERSGTTLLRLMLSHHPAIACTPELELVVERVGEDGGWPDVGAYGEWLATHRIFHAHRLSVDPALDYPSLAQSFVDQLRARTEKPIFGATCHKGFDRLTRLWPDARFVHLVRDGRDVARSCTAMGWTGHVWYGAERWIEAETLWDRLERAVPAERRVTVRYEDLVRDPESVLAATCRFLGCDYDPAMLSYVTDSTYERPDPALIDRWRRELAPRELGLLERRMGALLAARGYAPSGVAPLEPGPLLRLALAVRNELGRLRFRRRRYGLALMLRSRLANALGLKGAQRALALQRNAIDEAFLD